MLNEATFVRRHDQRESPVGVANRLCRHILVWRKHFTIRGPVSNRVRKLGNVLNVIITCVVRALLILSYLSYCEVHYGNHMGQETMQICTGLVQVRLWVCRVPFLVALKYWNIVKINLGFCKVCLWFGLG